MCPLRKSLKTACNGIPIGLDESPSNGWLFMEFRDTFLMTNNSLAQREISMKPVKFIALAAFAAMLPAVAFAQNAADVAYCKAMGAKYREYNKGADPAANIAVAVYKCETKPAEAISVLEKELKVDKIALPPR